MARATSCGEIALLVAAVAVMRLWGAVKDLVFSDAWSYSAYSLVAHGEQGPTFNEFTLEHQTVEAMTPLQTMEFCLGMRNLVQKGSKGGERRGRKMRRPASADPG